MSVWVAIVVGVVVVLLLLYLVYLYNRLVRLRNELTVEVDENLDVRLTGWAEPVFAGELSGELLEALERL